MQIVTELGGQPVIGRWYLVPTVHGEVYGVSTHWPVWGTYHEDAEIIGFPHWHYHLDHRFLNRDLMQAVCRNWLDPCAAVYGVPLTDRPPDARSLAKPELRRRLCQREITPFPYERATWYSRLENRYRDVELAVDLHCPHKGFPLAGLRADPDGCVTCPLHGLRWNLQTRRMAPLFPQRAPPKPRVVPVIRDLFEERS